MRADTWLDAEERAHALLSFLFASLRLLCKYPMLSWRERRSAVLTGRGQLESAPRLRDEWLSKW